MMEIVEVGKYSPKTLLCELERVFKNKTNGNPFDINDIYQYIYKGGLPFSLGGNEIKVVSRVGSKVSTIEVTAKRKKSKKSKK